MTQASDLGDARPKAPEPIPLNIVCGFLGSGKTTFLNRLLRDVRMRDALVVVNEFGDVSLDHLFLSPAESEVVRLQSGCLCCSLRDELTALLESLLRALDNGRMPRFNRLVIETTGLADPIPMLHAVTAHPYLSKRFRLSGVITTFDCLNGEATLDHYVEALRQLAVADCIVFTKRDLVADSDLARVNLSDAVRRVNPGARQIEAADEHSDATALFENFSFDSGHKIADVGRWLGAEAFAATLGAASPRLSLHATGLSARVHSLSLCDDKSISPSVLDAFVKAVTERFGPFLLRAKGLVRLSDDPDRPAVIQAVQAMFFPARRLAAWPDEDRRTRLVFIVQDLDVELIRQMWTAFAGLASPMEADPLSSRPRSSGGLFG